MASTTTAASLQEETSTTTADDAALQEEARRLVEALERGEANEVLGPLYRYGRSSGTAALPRHATTTPPSVAPEYAMGPADDEVVQKTVAHVGPDHFPPLKASYDLVAVGAGVAGLLSVIVGKSLGKRCLLVEKHYMGGDCLIVGCFPSKCLIACAKRAHEVRTAKEFGVFAENVSVDFPAVMRRARELRLSIAPHDSVARYARDFCEDVVIAHAAFQSENSLLLTDEKGATQRVTFEKCVVCTGASPFVPAVLEGVPHLTNGNFFNLEDLPPRVSVVGAGPIGVEFAQALQRCGSSVTIFEASAQLLVREDPDAAQILSEALVADGVQVLCGATVLEVQCSEKGEQRYAAPWATYFVKARFADGSESRFECEAVLNATGRAPNVSGMGLAEAGVAYDTRSGVHVDDFGKTTNDKIYAAGDVCSAYKFTHAADFMGRIAVRNAFLDARSPYSRLLVPWCTYSDPEIAHVGLYERELSDEPCDTYVRHLRDVDRCKCEGTTVGFVKITCKAGTDEILGATVVGPNAGDLISELSVALQNNIGLRHLAATIHPYPTTAEAIRQCAALVLPRTRNPALDSALQLRMAALRERDGASSS